MLFVTLTSSFKTVEHIFTVMLVLMSLFFCAIICNKTLFMSFIFNSSVKCSWSMKNNFLYGSSNCEMCEIISDFLPENKDDIPFSV